MTLLRTLAAALLLSPVLLWADTQFGYTNGTMNRNTVFRLGSTKKQGMALGLSHDKLQALKGQTLNGLTTAFGSVNQVVGKKVTLFVTTQLDGQPLLEQEATVSSANKWLSYKFDKPYTISGQEEALYVGFTLETNENTTNAMHTDQGEALRGCTYAWNNGEWTDLFTIGQGNADIKLDMAGQVALTDVMLKEIDIRNIYHKAEQDYHYECEVFNFGTETITSLEVKVKTNDEERVLAYEGLSLQQMANHTIQLPVIASDKAGDIEVSVEVTKVNGTAEADQVLADNRFETGSFFYPATMERNILTEEFTGTGCINCPAGKRTLEAAVAESGLPCIEVMHHAGYQPDFYSMDADWDYTMYYGGGGTYAPGVMINRVLNPDPKICTKGVPVFRSEGLSKADVLNTLQLAALRQPYVSLGLTSEFDAESRQVDVTFTVRAHNDLPGATLFNIFLIQDSIIGYQANGGTNWPHNGVLRRVLTGNSWGMRLPDSYGRDSVIAWQTSFELPEAIFSDFWTPATLEQAKYPESAVTIPTDVPHMRLVAFVANYDPQDINNNAIYNSIEVPLDGGRHQQAGFDAEPTTSALQRVERDETPAPDGIFDLSGRRYQTAEGLPSGLYIIHGKKTMICADRY